MHNQDLPIHLLYLLKNSHLQLSAFSMSLLLQLANDPLWKTKAMDTLLSAFHTFFSVAVAASLPAESSWLQNVCAPPSDHHQRSPLTLVDRVLLYNRNPQGTCRNQQLLSSLLTLGFELLDGGKKESKESTSMMSSTAALVHIPSVRERTIDAGSHILFHLIARFPDVGYDLVRDLQTRIYLRHESAIQLLHRVLHSPHTADTVRRHTEELKQTVEYLSNFTDVDGMKWFRAIRPLLRTERDVRDLALKALHKLMFNVEMSVSAQLLVIDACFLLIRTPFVERSHPLGPRRASSARDALASQPVQSLPSIDKEVFFQLRDQFMHTLQQQAPIEVRERLYTSLLEISREEHSLRPYVIDLLKSHFRNFLQSSSSSSASHTSAAPASASASPSSSLLSKARGPLVLDRAVDARTIGVIEPLGSLLFTLSELCANADEEARENGEDEEDFIIRPSQRAVNKQTHEQAKGRLESLLNQLCQCKTLRELGLKPHLIEEATMDASNTSMGMGMGVSTDAEEGVAAVLHAHVMHDVLISCMDVMMRRAERMARRLKQEQYEDEPGSTSQPQPTNIHRPPLIPHLTGEDCYRLLRLFQLFMQLHRLLTEKSTSGKKKEEKKGETKKKGKKGKKKKKKADSDEDEDEEEEDADESDDGDDGTGSSGKGKGRRGRVADQSRSKAPEAVTRVVARRHRLTSLRAESLIGLLRRSQQKEDDEPMEYELHSSQSSSQSSARPQLHVNASPSQSSQYSHSRPSTVSAALSASVDLQLFLVSDLVKLLDSWESGGKGEVMLHAHHLCELAPLMGALEFEARATMRNKCPPDGQETTVKMDDPKPRLIYNALLRCLRLSLQLGIPSLLTFIVNLPTKPDQRHKLFDHPPAPQPESESDPNANAAVAPSHTAATPNIFKCLNFFMNRCEQVITYGMRGGMMLEARILMELLVMLTPLIFVEEDPQQFRPQVIEKRMAWTAPIFKRDLKDTVFISLLLDALLEVKHRPDAQMDFLLQLARNTKGEVEEGDESYLGFAQPIDIDESHVARFNKVIGWMVKWMNGALSEVEILLKRIKPITNNKEREYNKSRLQRQNIELAKAQQQEACKRLHDLAGVLDALCHANIERHADDRLRILPRFFTHLTTLISSFENHPDFSISHCYRSITCLLKHVADQVRPSIDAFIENIRGGSRVNFTAAIPKEAQATFRKRSKIIENLVGKFASFENALHKVDKRSKGRFGLKRYASQVTQKGFVFTARPSSARASAAFPSPLPASRSHPVSKQSPAQSPSHKARGKESSLRRAAPQGAPSNAANANANTVSPNRRGAPSQSQQQLPSQSLEMADEEAVEMEIDDVPDEDIVKEEDAIEEDDED